jgi:transposase InsO family protein
LTPHETPSYPWQVISSDLFTWDDKEYLVMVDHLSRFFEVFRLQNTKGTDVIIRMKETFARLGIPEKVISDNGPQYASQELRDFAREWNFTNFIFSPR